MSTKRLLGSWLVLAVVMSANGLLRELVLVPALGVTASGVVSAAFGLVIILGVTWLLFRPLAGQPMSVLTRASVTLVILTVAFEFLLGHYVDGKSWTELVRNYAIWEGRLWPILLVVLALTPFLWGRWMTRGPAAQGNRAAGRGSPFRAKP